MRASSRSRSATRAGEVEEVQDVGVAGQLLGELAIGRGQLGGEVRQCGAGSVVQAVHDLVGQHVARPAVLDGGRGVPVTLGGFGELVEQDRD